MKATDVSPQEKVHLLRRDFRDQPDEKCLRRLFSNIENNGYRLSLCSAIVLDSKFESIAQLPSKFSEITLL